MAINTQTIRIDLNTGKHSIPVAYAHQNDSNRQLTFALYNNGVAYSPSSTTAKFAYKSPVVNGEYSVITGSQMATGTITANLVTVTLPSTYTQVSGVGLLTMILTTSGNTLRPINIKFIVQSSVDGDDTVMGASDFPESLFEYMDDWMAENEPTEIANLKSDLNAKNKTFIDFSDNISNELVIANDFIYGRYLSAGFANVTNYARNREPYQAGKYEIGPYASNGFIAFEYISDTQGQAIFNNYVSAKQTITATRPFYITFNNITGDDQIASINENFVVKRISTKTTMEDAVSDLVNTVDTVSETVDKIIVYDNPINIFDGVFVLGEQVATSSGAFVPGDSWARTGYIAIKQGVVNIGANSLTAPATVFQHCALYDENKNKLSAFPYTGITVNNASDLYYQTVTASQDGYIAFDVLVGAVGTCDYYVSQETNPTGYKSYYEPKETINPNLLPDINISDITASMTYGTTPSQAKKASFVNGDTLTVESNSIMKNQTMTFFAKIGTFDAVYIGHGQEEYGYYIKVDNTSVTYMSNGASGTSVSHGLTISDFIFVLLNIDYELNIKYTIVTAGGVFTRSQQINMTTKGDVFVLNENSSLTNAVLTWNCDDYKKPIWVFGDSYFTLYSPTRWTHYVVQEWKYDTMLLNAYPGEASETAYNDLTNALEHGTPKYLLWCLGMNDHDTSSAINAVWLEKVEAIKTICEQRGTTLILATIPNVTNSAYNNTFKNQYVIGSGYRYVDFANAVDGVNGWLSSDGVHPSELGGRLLASKAIADCPELLQET